MGVFELLRSTLQAFQVLHVKAAALELGKSQALLVPRFNLCFHTDKTSIQHPAQPSLRQTF